ncbi:MAG TPA: BON domain-containing protein [Sandaracinaceae bacterium LLY-WYZ-13_1]|nr:BON domain-containing protein [Sandaracinaceae bacterium LLY-WYZ-13_1]
MRSTLAACLTALGLAGALACEEPAAEDVDETDEAPAAEPAPEATEAFDPSDEAIADAVRTELWLEDAIAPGAIEVSVSAGIVSLDGEVGSVIAERRAKARAEAVRGVRALVDRVEVDPPERRDDELLEDVQEALVQDPTTESYEVEADVRDGRVTLEGEVGSWQEKMLAEHVAGGVRGVTAVDNRVRVAVEADRPDREIAQDVQSRLAHDIRVDAALVDVAVEEGSVVLTGTVGSVWEKRLAARSAHVAGVREVDASQLEVEPFARDRMRRPPDDAPEDEAVARAVRDAWRYDPRVSPFELEVRVDDGLAILRGTVGSAAARWAAEQDARHALGVWRVRSFLRVSRDEPPEAETLARRVREAMARNPYLERAELTVGVNDRRVRLSGVVDSAFEREEAVRVARSVGGVGSVVDDVRALDDDREVVADWVLEANVEEQLYWDPRVEAHGITVAAEDGRVRLSGVAADWTAYLHAIEGAYDAGAASVDADLQLRRGPPALRAATDDDGAGS